MEWESQSDDRPRPEHHYLDAAASMPFGPMLSKIDELGCKAAAAIELIGGAHDGRTTAPTYEAYIGMELLNRDDELPTIKRKIFAIQKRKRERHAPLES